MEIEIQRGDQVLTIEYDEKLVEKVKKYTGQDQVTKGDIALFFTQAIQNAVVDGEASQSTNQANSK